VFEIEHDAAEPPVLQLVEFISAHIESLGHFVSVGHPTQLGSQVLLGPLKLASERSYGSGSPVGGADGVEDGASNALRSKALKRYAASFVVPSGRLDQAERAGTSEFVTVDVAGKLHGHLEDDVFHEREVLLDQRRQLDIHRAHTLAGLHPRSAGSDASSPLFVVALVRRPEGLSVAIRGVSAGSTTTLSDSARFLPRRPHQRRALAFQQG
jgi:hypothetical protein